jgi:hypothetical protein
LTNNAVGAKGINRPSSAATRRKGDPVGIYNDKLDGTKKQMLGFANFPTS